MRHRVYTLASAIGFATASCDPGPLALSDQDSGRDVALAMHQGVDVTLHTVGPGGYGTPTISSPVVSFEGMTYPEPQRPSGPTQLYQFMATAKGSTVVSIPFDGGLDAHAPFTLTFSCCAQ